MTLHGIRFIASLRQDGAFGLSPPLTDSGDIGPLDAWRTPFVEDKAASGVQADPVLVFQIELAICQRLKRRIQSAIELQVKPLTYPARYTRE